MHDVQGSGLAVIFHRGGVLFFVIDVMVTVVFEVSLTGCVVVGTFRLQFAATAWQFNTLVWDLLT